LPERTAPEWAYLETKFAAFISYGLTADFLTEVLLTRGAINVAGVYRKVQRVAERMETELGEEKGHFIDGCQRDWDALPPPGSPFTVGLDGGFVHAKEQKSRGEGWFEVIADKSVPQEGAAKCFAYVQTYDPKPKRRLFEVLNSQGLQANQQVTFLSEGADDGRELPLYLSPESEHWLDWFHVAMRLTVMGQLAKGLADEPQTAPAAVLPAEAPEETLEAVDISSRWAGLRVGRACSCRYGPGCSTRSGRTPSGAGTRHSARKASRPRKRHDPPGSPALDRLPRDQDPGV
jgi:hypothetical protein